MQYYFGLQHRLRWLERVTTIYVFSKKNITIFHLIFFFFTAMKYCSIMLRPVKVTMQQKKIVGNLKVKILK